ncbi:MAG: hypothetical protein QOI73_2663 [Solirubrobacteraceae bacterium]|nr:hypothetical protein [Solirubrobacteraceae bacterium]
MIGAGASRDLRAPKREPGAGGRPAPSGPAEANVAVGVAPERGQLKPDRLGTTLARAVAERAQARGDPSAQAPEVALVQRSPKAWAQADATKKIVALTAGWGFTSRWPAVQVLVASYGQLPAGGLEQREAILGDIEHAMARWRSNQRESTGLKTDLDLSKRAALDGLATQIARERAEIAADKARRSAAAKARSTPPTAPPLADSAPPRGEAVVDPRPSPGFHVPRPLEPAPKALIAPVQIGDFVDSWSGSRDWIELEYQRQIILAHGSGDAKLMADLKTQLTRLGLEDHYRLPSDLELEHPVPRSEPVDAIPEDLRGAFLGLPFISAPKPIPGFGNAESVSLDRYFGSKIREAATGPEAARRELDAELIDAGLEHRYVRDASGEEHPDVFLGASAIGAVASSQEELIPGFSPKDSARTDGHFRRRIREAVRAGDEALMATIAEDLIEQGLEFRYVRGYGSSEHGQPRSKPSDVDLVSPPAGLDALTNPAGGDQEAPHYGLFEPGAVSSFQPSQIPGLSPQESRKLDGYFARAIRQAIRTQDLRMRTKLLTDIDVDLIKRGIEQRYIRAVDRDHAIYYPNEPAAGQDIGTVRGIHGQPDLIPGLSATQSAENDVYFRREIRKAMKSGDPARINDVTTQLTSVGLKDRYYLD